MFSPCNIHLFYELFMGEINDSIIRTLMCFPHTKVNIVRMFAVEGLYCLTNCTYMNVTEYLYELFTTFLFSNSSIKDNDR